MSGGSGASHAHRLPGVRMRELESRGMQCLAPEAAQRRDQLRARAARQAQAAAVDGSPTSG